MIYNQNNVATEASPYTTDAEKKVGLQLCEMLGYNRQKKGPAPWGHITCVSVSAYGSSLPSVAFMFSRQPTDSDDYFFNTFSMPLGWVRRQSRGHLGK